MRPVPYREELSTTHPLIHIFVEDESEQKATIEVQNEEFDDIVVRKNIASCEHNVLM